MVQPHLTYGVTLWGPTYQCHLKQLFILQKKAIRCINKAHYNTHTEPLFIRSKILKLDDIYKFELYKFMFDCIKANFQSQYLTISQPMQPYIYITQDKGLFLMLLKHTAPFLKDLLHTTDQKLGQKYHSQIIYKQEAIQ